MGGINQKFAITISAGAICGTGLGIFLPDTCYTIFDSYNHLSNYLEIESIENVNSTNDIPLSIGLFIPFCDFDGDMRYERMNNVTETLFSNDNNCHVLFESEILELDRDISGSNAMSDSLKCEGYSQIIINRFPLN